MASRSTATPWAIALTLPSSSRSTARIKKAKPGGSSPSHGQTRSRPDLHFDCGASEPHHTYADSQTHKIDQRLLKEVRESVSRAVLAFCSLQSVPDSSVVAGYPGDGSRDHGLGVGSRG